MEDVIASEIQDGNLKMLSANFHSHDNTIEELLSLLHADYCMMLSNQQQVVSAWISILYKGKKKMNELVDVVILWFTHRKPFTQTFRKYTILFCKGKKLVSTKIQMANRIGFHKILIERIIKSLV